MIRSGTPGIDVHMYAASDQMFKQVESNEMNATATPSGVRPPIDHENSVISVAQVNPALIPRFVKMLLAQQLPLQELSMPSRMDASSAFHPEKSKSSQSVGIKIYSVVKVVPRLPGNGGKIEDRDQAHKQD